MAVLPKLQNLPPGNRALRRRQSHHLDAMSNVRGDANRLVDGQPVGGDDVHPGDGQPEGVADARQADGHPADGRGGLHPGANRVAR